MELTEQRDVIQAAIEGECIEVITLGKPYPVGEFEYCALANPERHAFNFCMNGYRVKVEPGRVWAGWPPHGVACFAFQKSELPDFSENYAEYIELTADVKKKLGIS